MEQGWDLQRGCGLEGFLEASEMAQEPKTQAHKWRGLPARPQGESSPGCCSPTQCRKVSAASFLAGEILDQCQPKELSLKMETFYISAVQSEPLATCSH